MNKELNPYMIINFSGFHNDCWSNTIDFPVKIINFKKIDNKYLKLFIIFNEKYKKKLAKTLKKHYRSIVINSYQHLDDGEILASIIKPISQNSIFNVIDKYAGIFINTLGESGNEIWKIAIQNNLINDFLSEINNFIEIKSVIVNKFKIPTSINLTPREAKILQSAEKLGYFDYPRKISSIELSNVLGIKRSTLIYYLRIIQKKIIKYYLNYLNL